MQLDNANGEMFYVDPKPILTCKRFKSITLYNDETYGKYGLLFTFDEEGTLIWAEATESAIGGSIGLIINNILVQVTGVNSSITSGISILQQNYSKEELIEFKKSIKNKCKTE